MSGLIQNPGILDAASAAASTAQGISGYITAQSNASTLQKEGKFQQQEMLREATQLLGKQVVGYASGGVEVGSGTPLDVLTETAHREALAASRVRAVSNNQASNQEMAGLAAFSRGLATGADTLLTNYSKRAIANPAVNYPSSTRYRIASPSDLFAPRATAAAPKRVITLPGGY